MEDTEVVVDKVPSLNTLCLRSNKRTRDLFVDNFQIHHGDRLENSTALQLKLATKINDDYGLVKDIPPPSKPQPAAAAQKETASVEPTPKKIAKKKGAEIKDITIEGTNPFPSRPGVALGEEDKGTESEVSDQIYHQAIEALASRHEGKTPTQSHGLILYQNSAAIAERIQPPSKTRGALALRGGPQFEKPTWHAPWKLMRVISGHLGWVRSLTVDPSNEWFATGSADRTIKIWDLATGVLKLTLTGHISAVRGLAVSSRHPYLFSCGEDKQIKCWDLECNKVIRHYHGHLSGVYSLALHPTLDILVTGGRDSTARVWDMRTKSEIHTLAGHTNTVASVACQSTDPQVISGSHDSTIRLWDLAKGATMATLTHHKKSVRALALHPSEYTMASGAPDNIKLWKFPEGKFMRNFSGHQAIVNTLSVNSDNVLVSGADNGSMYFWDWKSGYCFQKLQTTVQPGSLESEAGIYASTFDQTGSRLLCAEADKTIKIYKEDESETPESYPIDPDWRPPSKWQ